MVDIRQITGEPSKLFQILNLMGVLLNLRFQLGLQLGIVVMGVIEGIQLSRCRLQ